MSTLSTILQTLQTINTCTQAYRYTNEHDSNFFSLIYLLFNRHCFVSTHDVFTKDKKKVAT